MAERGVGLMVRHIIHIKAFFTVTDLLIRIDLSEVGALSMHIQLTFWILVHVFLGDENIVLVHLNVSLWLKNTIPQLRSPPKCGPGKGSLETALSLIIILHKVAASRLWTCNLLVASSRFLPLTLASACGLMYLSYVCVCLSGCKDDQIKHWKEISMSGPTLFMLNGLWLGHPKF